MIIRLINAITKKKSKKLVEYSKEIYQAEGKEKLTDYLVEIIKENSQPDTEKQYLMFLRFCLKDFNESIREIVIREIKTNKSTIIEAFVNAIELLIFIEKVERTDRETIKARRRIKARKNKS